MALSMIVKFRSFLSSIRPIDLHVPFSFFQVYKHSKLFSFSSSFLRPVCTSTRTSYCSRPPSTSEFGTIADGLISVFTKRPFSIDDQELLSFKSSLNTEIVEIVLKRLRSWKIAHMFFNWASGQDDYRHNAYTYNAMASILSHARQNASLRLLIFDVVNSMCSMTPGVLGLFLRCLGSAGMVEEATMLFDQVKKMGLCVPNQYSYTCLLEVLSKSCTVDLVEERFKEMCDLGWEPDKYTLTPLLQVYCNAGKFEDAFKIFNQIDKQGWIDGHVFSILVLSFSKWGEVDKAFELIETMEERHLTLNEKTFYILIHGYMREFRVDKALRLFEKMKIQGFLPDISLYDVLIGGLCEKKEVKKALYLFADMKKQGIPPDVGILAKLVPLLDEERMVGLLKERQEDLDVQDVVLLYNSVLSGLVKNGSVDKAYHLLLTVMGDEVNGDNEVDSLFRFNDKVCPSTYSFNVVIDGLCQIGKLDVALCLYQKMVQFGSKPNTLLYNNLLHHLSNLNRLEECYKFLKEMKEWGLEPTHFTYNTIYGCLCNRADISAALDLLREMRVYGHEPWIKHSTSLVKQLCKHGRVVEASNFLANMVAEGFLPDIVTYSAVLDGFLKIQEIDQAVELLRKICACGYCPDVVAYNTLINGFCKAKRLSEARNLLDEMLEKGVVPSVVTYNSLIDGWCKSGDVDRAILFFRRMIGEQREPNVITYTTLIDGLCNIGKPDDALVLWNEMEEKGCAPNGVAFMALIHGLCKCGRPDLAAVYFHQMKEKKMKPDPFIFVALICAFLSSMEPTKAFEILREMVDEKTLPEVFDKNHSILRDAIVKLSKDDRTSSNIKNLVAEGGVPTISLLEVEDEEKNFEGEILNRDF